MPRILFSRDIAVLDEVMILTSEKPGFIEIKLNGVAIEITPVQAQKLGTELINHSWPYSQRNRA